MEQPVWSGRIAILLALGALLGVSTANAAVEKPAPHRHHYRMCPQAPSLGANRIPAHPAGDALPAAPRRRQAHQKAILPALAHGIRQANGSKGGASHAGIPSASRTLLAVAVRSLGTRQNLTPDSRADVVTSGRGPPRGSPITPLSGRSSSSTTSASVSASSAHSRMHTAFGHSELSSRRFVSFSRSASAHLHAARPEGAMACLLMPSNGDYPCPA